MLHHTASPENLLKEARRVARKIIVMEDVYTTVWQKYATYIMDSLVNLEFKGHPHSNKNDTQWREVFQRLGFEIKSVSICPFWKLFLSATYILERKEYD